MTEERGVPINQSGLPAWARPCFSPAQLNLEVGLLWVNLIFKWKGRDPSRYSLAQRLYIHTVGRDRKEWETSIRQLADDLELSENTVIAATDDLEGDGWLLVSRQHRNVNFYRLAWPVRDVLAPPKVKEVPLCGVLTSKGRRCAKRAGRGTQTPGVGPCKQHLPPLDAEAHQPELLLPIDGGSRSDEPDRPQPLRSTADAEQGLTATVAALDRNGCGVRPQPLRHQTATVAVQYVGTTCTSEVRPPGLLSEGQPHVGDAPAREAPAAQPENEFAGRSLITAIPRYRTAPGWVRKHLAALAAAALHAGLGRDAIVRYAELVIAEQAYQERQHIPEFRGALARLSRDVAHRDACAEHGRPECSCATPDRPWTDQDQADLERAMAFLADDLDTTGT